MDERLADSPASDAPSPGKGAHADTAARSSGRQPFTRRMKARLVGRHHAIAPLDSLIERAEAIARATDQTVDQAAAVVVEDLERDASALTLRTAPLVPVCGVLVAISSLAAKSEGGSHVVSEVFVSSSVLLAVLGLAFLTRALFLYAGRRLIGLSPTVDDISFARVRLVRRHAAARRGGALAALALAFLIIGIFSGVHINVS